MSNLKNILVGATLIVGSFFGRSKVVAVSLVDDGKAVGVIIVAEKPTISAKLAARELQHHIEKITGALLEIKPDAEVANVKGVRILVGESEATRKRDLKNENFQTQEYLIHIKDDTIILMGRDWRDTLANRAEKGRAFRGCPESAVQAHKNAGNIRHNNAGFGRQ